MIAKLPNAKDVVINHIVRTGENMKLKLTIKEFTTKTKNAYSVMQISERSNCKNSMKNRTICAVKTKYIVDTMRDSTEIEITKIARTLCAVQYLREIAVIIGSKQCRTVYQFDGLSLQPVDLV